MFVAQDGKIFVVGHTDEWVYRVKAFDGVKWSSSDHFLIQFNTGVIKHNSRRESKTQSEWFEECPDRESQSQRKESENSE